MRFHDDHAVESGNLVGMKTGQGGLRKSLGTCLYQGSAALSYGSSDSTRGESGAG
jgi:hypothetical protein